MKTKILFGFLILATLVLSGCGGETDKSVCVSNEECTFYELYDCVYAINKDSPKAEQKIEQGPPSMAANCLGEDYFDFDCAENKCAKVEKCELVCDLEEYQDIEECPATSQACNLFKKCGC
ncbi:hypothetical protein HOC13_00280 [Candidatus Woesearchaeota archaeon]|jgi:hypothetical protein|nr:hypothetical protein [Candidatus Woesearchaeota archaeon]